MKCNITLVRDDNGSWGLEGITVHRPYAEPERVPTNVDLETGVNLSCELADLGRLVTRYLEANKEPKRPILKLQILQMCDEYRTRTGKDPTVLEVTPSKELEICMLGFNEIGDLSGRLAVEGARNIFPTFMGLKPVWGAKEFRVRGEDDE